MKFSQIESQIENKLIDTLLLINSSLQEKQLRELNILDLSKRIYDSVKEILKSTSMLNKETVKNEDQETKETDFPKKSNLKKPKQCNDKERYSHNKSKSNINIPSINNPINEYEKQLIKLEQDIRQHIKIEFQMKIYCESLEAKIEELQREIQEKESLSNMILDLEDTINKQKQEIENYKSKINQIKSMRNIYNSTTSNFKNNLIGTSGSGSGIGNNVTLNVYHKRNISGVTKPICIEDIDDERRKNDKSKSISKVNNGIISLTKYPKNIIKLNDNQKKKITKISSTSNNFNIVNNNHNHNQSKQKSNNLDIFMEKNLFKKSNCSKNEK